MADEGSVRRDYRGVDGAVNDADQSRSAREAAVAAVAKRSNAVTVAQALKSERKAAKNEGARAFGTPLGTEQDRQRQNQSTDANN